MIIVTTSLSIYGVQGKKFDILRDFLQDKIEYRACEGPGIFKDMIQEISDFVDELNNQYKKTKVIHFTHQDTYSYQHGQLNFFREGARYATLSISYYRLNWYEATKKGGQQ